MNKVLVYTANFGGKDHWQEPLISEEGVDYWCFTDKPVKSDVFTMSLPLNTSMIMNDIESMYEPNTYPIRPEVVDNLAAKYFKVLHREVLPNKKYDYKIWMDSNVRIVGEVKPLVEMMGEHGDIGVFEHGERECIYTEAKMCKKLRKDNSDVIDAQVAAYKKEGMPRKYGLWTCKIIVYRAKAKSWAAYDFSNFWFQQILIHSIRDQISFPYCLWEFHKREIRGYAPLHLVSLGNFKGLQYSRIFLGRKHAK